MIKTLEIEGIGTFGKVNNLLHGIIKLTVLLAPVN